jgi:glycosyltransferase involved in cell wall biosynthesis
MGTSPRQLDVLFLTHNFPRHEGDFAGRFLERLARLLMERGLKIGVVVPHAPGAAEFEIMSDIPVWRFRYGPDDKEVLAYRGQAVAPSLLGSRGLWAHYGFFSSFRLLAQRVVRETNPSLLHAHWWVPAGWVARSIVRKERFVVTMHGSDARLIDGKPWMRPLAGRVLRRADMVTVVSNGIAKRIGNRYPGIRDRIGIAPMPPEDSVFSGAVKESLNSTPTILCVTRYTVQKRNDVLLRALAILREQGVAYACRFIGEGGSERENVETLAAGLGLREAVTFVPSMPQVRLAEEYRRADVTVLPAVEEGFGLTLVEAQLCGCPVIGARSGGLTDIITDHETGLLSNPDDANDLARALRTILTDMALRTRLARQGQESARANFSARAIVDRFLKWYQLG